MFGIYLNGYWDRDGYHGVDISDDSFVPRLVGLFPFGEEAQAFATILEQDATNDWKGDYEVSLYRPSYAERQHRIHADVAAPHCDQITRSMDADDRLMLEFENGRADDCESETCALSTRNRTG